MNFEKISEKAYRKFWDEQDAIIESPEQKENRINHFLTDFKLPERKTGKSAGYDFSMPYDVLIKPGHSVLIGTGIKLKLDDDKVLKIYPRSSYGIGKELMEANTVGIVDSDYYNNKKDEGHIYICLRNYGTKSVLIRSGERACQGIIVKYYTVEGDSYGDGPEREGGIGSTTVPLNDKETKNLINKVIPETLSKVRTVLDNVGSDGSLMTSNKAWEEEIAKDAKKESTVVKQCGNGDVILPPSRKNTHHNNNQHR